MDTKHEEMTAVEHAELAQSQGQTVVRGCASHLRGELANGEAAMPRRKFTVIPTAGRFGEYADSCVVTGIECDANRRMESSSLEFGVVLAIWCCPRDRYTQMPGAAHVGLFSCCAAASRPTSSQLRTQLSIARRVTHYATGNILSRKSCHSDGRDAMINSG